MNIPRTLVAMTLLAGLGLCGCQREKPQEEGKVYTSNQKGSTEGGTGNSGNSSAQGGSGGGGNSSQGSSAGKAQAGSKMPNSPADTIDSRPSQASDNGSANAPQGQVVANPGAPSARDGKADGPAPKTTGGGH